MSRLTLYISKSSPICQSVTWMCRSMEIGFVEKVVNSVADMEDISERNPGKNLPVLQDNDLLLTEAPAILKYISEVVNKYGNSNKWTGLAWPEDFAARAKLDELLSYSQCVVKPVVKDYIDGLQSSMFDSVPDTTKYDKLRAVLQDLDYKKKGHHFLGNSHLTIVDLLVFSNL